MTDLTEIERRRARIDAYWRQQPNPLDPAVPVNSAHLLTASPTYEAIWRERTIGAAFDRYGLNVVTVPEPCGTCGSRPPDPCVTASGRLTRDHKLRRRG